MLKPENLEGNPVKNRSWTRGSGPFRTSSGFEVDMILQKFLAEFIQGKFEYKQFVARMFKDVSRQLPESKTHSRVQELLVAIQA